MKYRVFAFRIVKYRSQFVLASVLALSFAACSATVPRENSSALRTVTDDLGREVKVPERIERAISLAPSLTETIFAAGAGDRLVGVTSYCNYPAATASIEKVGDTLTPNIERIIALKPQLVFVSTSSQLESFTSVLKDQNIQVYVSNPSNFEDMVRGIRTLGTLFGTAAIADAKANEIENRARSLDESLKNTQRPKVFVQISNDPLFTIGRDSFLTQVIYRAGGDSVTKDVASAYPKLSKETALAMNPDVIILSDSDDNKEPNTVFRNSAAVKNGRVYRINADIISRPGPRLVDAIEQIAKDLHP